jgi:DNA-binding transcriptional ArsR family regulator
MSDEFEPDQFTLELLGAEHQNGLWVGKELLPIANRIRNHGGNEDDYRHWVLVSHLWTSYVGSTGDRVRTQDASLESAWRKSADHEEFDLEESLTALRERIAIHTGWAGRSGSRDRAVALVLVGFCIDHNCFTRTLSSYELAKHTSGISPKSVSRALAALTDHGLIREVQRTDRRTSTRSTKRYRVNLHWAAAGRQGGVTSTDARSTDKLSLRHEWTPPSDVWSRDGLGPGAQRVWEVLTDEPVTVRAVAELTGMSRRSAKRYLLILAEHALAGSKPGAPGEPTLYFRVDTPLDAIADMLGILGHVDYARWKIDWQQHDNRAAYPGTYRRLTNP